MYVPAWLRWVIGRDRGSDAAHLARRHALPFVIFAAVGVALAVIAPDTGVDRGRWQFLAAMAGSAFGLVFMLVWLREVGPRLRCSRRSSGSPRSRSWRVQPEGSRPAAPC
jgi:hypothetical protein